jgi:raffinose/stachyose/melibiose transport system substrate-binding protein
MADIFIYYTGSGLYDINAERNAMDITNEPFASNLTDDFKRIASLNGRLYAIPGGSSAAGTILYNKAIYRELGLSVPRTWNEFIANCQKIQAAGRTAVIATLKDTWTSQIIILGDQYNVNVAQPNFPADYTANRPNGKYANNALARRGFEKIAEVRPFLNRDYMATTYEQGAEMLALGQGAHWPILTATLPLINSNYPDKIDDIGAFGVPGDDPNNAGLTVFPSNGFYIYRNTKVPDLVKRWVNYYLSQEGIAAFTSTEKPSGPFPIKGIVLTDTYSAVKELQPFIDQGKTGLALQFESPVKGPNLEQICVEVYAGYMSPMEAAIAYDQDVQKQAIQLNLPGW